MPPEHSNTEKYVYTHALDARLHTQNHGLLWMLFTHSRRPSITQPTHAPIFLCGRCNKRRASNPGRPYPRDPLLGSNIVKIHKAVKTSLLCFRGIRSWKETPPGDVASDHANNKETHVPTPNRQRELRNGQRTSKNKSSGLELGTP